MRTTAVAIAAVAVMRWMAIGAAQQPRPQDVELQAAIRTEAVDGDLERAISQYRGIAEKYKGDRAAVATALVHIAQCYQKLGDPQARAVFTQIVREYPDQPREAQIARVQLEAGGTAAAAVKGDRAVWTGRDVDLFGTVSPDGRYLTYVDWAGAQNVMVRDLSSNTNRALTRNTRPSELGTGDFSAISRDGSRVAYWWAFSTRDGELRIATLSGDGAPAARVLRQGVYVRPFDWSPDGKWIAGLVDDTQLALVSVEDGAVRQLRSIDWRGVGKMVFSPDGRFIAYDVTSIDRRGRRDVKVIAVDGSVDTPVVVDSFRNHVMAWSASGDLVFSSDRTGTRSLWTLRVEDGHARGAARLVKENVRSTVSLGMTDAGTLYVWQPASPMYVAVSPFDVTGTQRSSEPAAATFQQFVDSIGRPRWSADGRHMVFVSCGLGGGSAPCSLFERDNGGPAREVLHGMWYFAMPALAPDGHAVVSAGSDLKGRRGIFLVDMRSGDTSMVVPGGTSNPRSAEWSSDGLTIHFVETDGKDTVLLARDVQSGKTRELFRAPGRAYSMRVSPDGRSVAYLEGEHSSELRVAPLAGGAQAARLLLNTRDIHAFQWMPDGDSVVALVRGLKSGDLWQAPLSGTPHKLDIDVQSWVEFHISPDASQVVAAAQVGNTGDQVWALENFLPASSRNR